MRRALAALDEQGLEHVLSAAELEALRFGARERVTDMDVGCDSRAAGTAARSVRRGGAPRA